MDAALLALGTPALWALAVGFFSPPVISIIQQSHWSEKIQSLTAFGFYLAVALVTAWLTGQFTAGGYIRLALLVFLTGAASYQALWKPTGVSPAIENATTPSSAPTSGG